jgi:hypothetical protein
MLADKLNDHPRMDSYRTLAVERRTVRGALFI